MKNFIKLWLNIIFFRLIYIEERVQVKYQNKIIDYEFKPRFIPAFLLSVFSLPFVLIFYGLSGFINEIYHTFDFKNGGQYQTVRWSCYQMVLMIDENKEDWFWKKYCYRNK